MTTHPIEPSRTSQKFVSLLCAGALALTPAIGVSVATAQENETCTLADGVKSGTLNWGIKQTFRNYVLGSVAKGAWTASGVGFQGERTASNGAFIFSPGSGSVESTAFPGEIHFVGHDNHLDMKLSDFKLNVSGNTGTISVDYISYESDFTYGEKGAQITGNDVPIVEINFSEAPNTGAESSNFRGTTTLTQEGTDLFLAYNAGETLDPVSGVLSCKQGGSTTSTGNSGGESTPGVIPPYVELPDGTPGLRVLKETYDTIYGLNALTVTGNQFVDTAENFYTNVFGGGKPAESASTPAPGVGETASYTDVASPATTGTGAGTTVQSGNAVITTNGAARSTTSNGGASQAGTNTTGSAAAATDNATCEDNSREVTSAEAQWAIKDSFQTYITGNIAKGDWELSGVGHNNGEFLFDAGTGAVDPSARTGVISFPGSLRFVGHGGTLDLRMSNLEIRFNGGAGNLYANVISNDAEGNTTDYGFVSIADLGFSSLNVSDSSASGTANVALNQTGYGAFATFYEPGTAMAPLSFSASLGGKAECGAATGAANRGASASGSSGSGSRSTSAAAAARDSAKAQSNGGSASKYGDSKASDSFGNKGNSGDQFQIRSAAKDSDDSEGELTPATLAMLIAAGFAVAGGTLTSFISRNPMG